MKYPSAWLGVVDAEKTIKNKIETCGRENKISVKAEK